MPAETGYQSRAGGQQTAQRVLLDTGGGALSAIAGGVGRLAQTGNAIALDQYRADRAQTRASEAADVARRFAEMRLSIDDESRALRTAAQPGGTGHVDAMKERIKTRRAALLEGITEDDVRANAETQFIDYESRLLTQEGDWQEGQRVGKLVNDTGQLSQVASNRVRGKPEAYSEELKAGYDAIAAMAVGDDVKTKLREQHEQQVTVSYGNAMLEKNPAMFKGLLASGAFDAILNPQQVEAFHNGIDVELRRQQAVIEHQANLEAKRDNDEIGAIRAELAGGVEVSPDRIVPLMQRAEARGDKSVAAALAVQLVQTQTKRETDTWTPAQWDNAITTLEGKAKRSPQEDIRLSALREGRSAAIQTYENRPGDWAAKNGFPPPIMNLAEPQSVAAYGQWRRVVMQETGGRDPGFPPAMLSEWKDKAKGTDKQKAQLLNEMQALPPEMRRAALLQVVPGDPIIQHVAMLKSRVSRQLALDGAVAKQANPKLVTNDQAQISYQAHVGQALSAMPPIFGANVKAAATNIYAGLAAQHGVGEFNRGLYAKAIDLALEQRVATWRGERVIVPPDLGAKGFEAKLSGWNAPVPAGASNGVPVDGAGQPIRIDYIKQNLTPRAVGNGRYMFVDASGAALMTKAAQPWVVDIRQLPSKAVAAKPKAGPINYAVAGQGGAGR